LFMLFVRSAIREENSFILILDILTMLKFNK